MPVTDLLPQLRIMVNSHCGRSCFFCRPSGEAIIASGQQLQCSDVVRVCTVAGRLGVNQVKLTGGDPALWDPLVDCVGHLKCSNPSQQLHVLSRHPRIGELAPSLFAAGVDLINLSIDTLHRDQHKRITGVDDLPAVLEALAKCVASGVSCKVNTVVMKGVNDREIDSIIAYCEHVGVRSLKLNDVIKDLQDQPMTHAARLLAIEHRTLSDLYYPMNEIVDRLYPRSTSVRTIRQGGLGHPMLMFSLPSGMDVILKDHCTGAWYSTLCEECDSYPCHDALMALRLTADAHLQFCLLRRGTNIDLRPDLDSEDDACLEKTIGSALRVYHDARFEVGDMPTAMNEGYCPLSVPSLRHGGL